MNAPLWVSVLWVVMTVTASSTLYETGGHLPLVVRAAVLGSIFVPGHIFWGFR